MTEQWKRLRLGAVWMGTALALACGQQEDAEVRAESVGSLSSPLTLLAARYDSTLKVPTCAAPAAGCDTNYLVNRRGTQQREPNAPNTLKGTCADQPSGTYMRDESVERVRIFTTDGSNLAPGKQVTIEVDVWVAFAFSQYDSLDLYYTADATQPQWVPITTIWSFFPDAQTMRATYTLPTGGGRVQAIRAAFQRGMASGPCWSDPYSYADRDDLAFTVEVPAPSLPYQLAGGTSFNLQRRQDGTVWAWGENSRRQLGDGTTTLRKAPVKVVGLNEVASISAGGGHSLAVKTNGTVWGWGDNTKGQVGKGLSGDYSAPAQTVGLSDVVSVAAGGTHSLALKQDGTVWAWGDNSNCQLGDGTQFTRNSPVQVPSLSGVIALAAGASHSMALMQDGTVWTWGANTQGELGTGTTGGCLKLPAQVSAFTDVSAISAGNAYSMALKQEGTVWAWGTNGWGQLGDSSSLTRSSPVQVYGLTGVVAIGAGSSTSAALLSDGTVWNWGLDIVAYFAGYSNAGRFRPVQVPWLSNVATLAQGSQHTLATKPDGAAWSWGFNGSGQLGDGTATSRSEPVQALGVSYQ
ncbi:hypothetical protein [Melittangium boletus]|uniref:RCC1-like domain-containing protein n=1 Tax=Melittangium boletus DSM 14713 TaxID=1294270 RepID=A0A250IB56_9BACT|nr:hypothetical protein [Melittangium boletus]ATB28381.1 hypothetical protein MEBOL_001827 [Melittangium boletus DSM 14713]